MTITISLPPETEQKLKERAIQSGRDLPGYVHHLIEKDVQSDPTLDEILAPIRLEFETSGMTEEELDTLVDEVRDEI
jgi:hypothetical protein